MLGLRIANARGARAAASAALVFPACAHRDTRGAPAGWPASAEWIVDGRTGERAGFEAMIDDLAKADVVFVGEDHGNPHHHEAQRRIAVALLERNPRLTIGMEMLQTDSQAAADRWVEGAIDLETFLREIDWRRTWGFPIELYRPLLELAREKRVPIVAHNATEATVQRLREAGIEGLTPEERTALPEMDLRNEAHQEWVRQAFRAHHDMPEAQFQRFYAIQVLWDETMAESIARVQRETGRPMIVFAGTGHLIRRLGIPSRLERRNEDLKTRVVLAVPAVENTPHEIRSSVEAGDADWLWITPDADAMR